MAKRFPEFSGTLGMTPKIHTIREDKKNRWKVGNNIHFVINNRTENRFQFAPVLKVKSIQKIEIKKRTTSPKNASFHHNANVFIVYIDDVRIFPDSNIIEFIAKNDGFDSVDNFFKWFDKDFKGKIIHWTDLKYYLG